MNYGNPQMLFDMDITMGYNVLFKLLQTHQNNTILDLYAKTLANHSMTIAEFKTQIGVVPIINRFNPKDIAKIQKPKTKEEIIKDSIIIYNKIIKKGVAKIGNI